MAATLAACAGTPEAGPDAGLAGTSWQLTRTTLGDRQNQAVAEPERNRYTLAFDADGRARMRLDCNRGSARWTAGTGAAGTLQFSEIISTRVMCPPQSLEQTLARQLTEVSAYELQGRELRLKLRDDDGELIWERAP